MFQSSKLKQFKNVAKLFAQRVNATHATFTINDNVMRSTNYDCTPLVKVDLNKDEQKIKVAILHKKTKLDFFQINDKVNKDTIIRQIEGIDKDNEDLINIMKMCYIRDNEGQWRYFSNTLEETYGSLDTYNDRGSKFKNFKLYPIDNELESSWRSRIFPEKLIELSNRTKKTASKVGGNHVILTNLNFDGRNFVSNAKFLVAKCDDINTKLSREGKKINVKIFNQSSDFKIGEHFRNDRDCTWLDRHRKKHYLFYSNSMFYYDKNESNEPDDTEERHARYIGFLKQKNMNDKRDPRRTSSTVKQNIKELKIRLANINGGVIINKKYHNKKIDLPVTDIAVAVQILVFGNDKPLFLQKDFPKEKIILKEKGNLTLEGSKMNLISLKTTGKDRDNNPIIEESTFIEKDEVGRLKNYFINIHKIRRFNCSK